MNNEDYSNENDNSSVIYTELDNHKFLFMGDAGVEVEKDMIAQYNLKDTEIPKDNLTNELYHSTYLENGIKSLKHKI